MLSFTCVSLAWLLGAISVARADLIYSTYGPTLTSAYANGPAHDNASVFTIASTVEITSISWDGAYLGNTLPADSFAVEIFGDSGGMPGSVTEFLASGGIARTDTGTTILDREIYHYVDTLATPIVIEAGTYYLDPVDDPSSDSFFWAVYNSLSGTTWSRDNPLYPNVGVWNATSGTPEFEVDGVLPAPEPSFGVVAGFICFLAIIAASVRSLGRWVVQRDRSLSSLQASCGILPSGPIRE
jgi:hypothetical protein